MSLGEVKTTPCTGSWSVKRTHFPADMVVIENSRWRSKKEVVWMREMMVIVVDEEEETEASSPEIRRQSLNAPTLKRMRGK